MAYKLFTTWYAEPVRRRRLELEFCLGENLSHFDEVCVLAQSVDRPEGFRGQWFSGHERQTYADLLALAGSASPQDIVVIANTDVVIPRYSLDGIAANIAAGQAYCLSRWDMSAASGINLFDSMSSQDAWAFLGPPRASIAGNAPIGLPGCDNRFAAELDAAGYVVLNPSHDIRVFHFHQSQHRPGNRPENRVPLPYLFVAPHKLGESPRYTRPRRASRRASNFQV